MTQKILVHDYAGHPFQLELSVALSNFGQLEVVHGYFAGDLGPKASFSNENVHDKIRIVPFELPETYDKGTYFKRRKLDRDYGRQVGAWILKEKPSVVLSGNTPTDAQLLILAAAKRVGAKFVNWVQDFYSVGVTQVLRARLPFIGAPISFLYRHLDRRVLRSAEANVFISESFKNRALGIGIDASKCFVVPNWGAVNEITETQNENHWANLNGISGRFVFLYTGTLGIKHRPDLIVELAKRFEMHADVLFVVVGQGRGVDWIAEEISNYETPNILLLPLQPFNEMSYVLGTADVTLAMLERDAGEYAVPSKVLNYLCAGKPVLLSSPEQNDASYIIKSSNAGISCSSDDEFIRGAFELYQDRACRTGLGKNARLYAEREFSIEKIAETFLNIIIV